MLRYPDIQIGLSSLGEIEQNALPANAIDHRQIDRIIPAGCSVLERHIVSLLGGQCRAVRRDLLLDSRIPAWRGHAQIGLWALLIELGVVEKFGVLGLQD